MREQAPLSWHRAAIDRTEDQRSDALWIVPARMGIIVENGGGLVSSRIDLEPFDVDHRAVVSRATSGGTGGLFLGGYADLS